MVKFCDCVVLFNSKNRALDYFKGLITLTAVQTVLLSNKFIIKIWQQLKKNQNRAIFPPVILERTYTDAGENQ